MSDQIFAEFSNQDLADAINEYLDTDCWTAEQVAEWRERYIENGYMVGTRQNFITYQDYPCIEGEEHSNLSFVWFLEDMVI